MNFINRIQSREFSVVQKNVIVTILICQKKVQTASAILVTVISIWYPSNCLCLGYPFSVIVHILHCVNNNTEQNIPYQEEPSSTISVDVSCSISELMQENKSRNPAQDMGATSTARSSLFFPGKYIYVDRQFKPISVGTPHLIGLNKTSDIEHTLAFEVP
jgi:hypothetical protein